MAHPRRAKMAENLAAAVGASAVVWDTHSEGAETNHLRAWRWLAEADDQRTGWGVVLEDDVIPCPDFSRQLHACLRHSPAPIVSLYLGRGRPPHRQQDVALSLGRLPFDPFSFLVSDEMLSGQGYAMRTPLFDAWPWVRMHTHPRTDKRPKLPIDEAITAWMRSPEQGTDAAYPVPSLVDHRKGPSLVTHWDEDKRTGKTALMTEECDPSGANLPELRKAWLFGRHSQWSSTSIRLGKNFTPSEENT